MFKRLLEYQNFLQNIQIYYSLRFSFLYNYCDSPTKLFSDLCLANFLDISAKSIFFRTKINKINMQFSNELYNITETKIVFSFKCSKLLF